MIHPATEIMASQKDIWNFIPILLRPESLLYPGAQAQKSRRQRLEEVSF
jgi:hypothetical protein